MKEGLSFTWDLSLENSAYSYLCFQLALLYSVSYFFFPLLITFVFMHIFFSISSNILFIFINSLFYIGKKLQGKTW